MALTMTAEWEGKGAYGPTVRGFMVRSITWAYGETGGGGRAGRTPVVTMLGEGAVLGASPFLSRSPSFLYRSAHSVPLERCSYDVISDTLC